MMADRAGDAGSAAGNGRLHIGIAGPASPRLFAAELGKPVNELPEGLGGVPVNHLVRALLDAGHQVTLATLDRTRTGEGLITFEGDQLTVVVGRYRVSGRARDAFRVERRAIAKALSTFQPQAASAHWSYEFALGAIESGTPTMVTVRDVPREIFRMQPTPYRLVRWCMHRRAMRRATRVAFNSPYTKGRLRSRRWRNATVLPNAIPDNGWDLRDRALPDPLAPCFISVNNGFGAWKNVEPLLRAFQLVLRETPAARLQLIGQGYERDGAAMQWAADKKLTHGVEFIGVKDNDETLSIFAQPMCLSTLRWRSRSDIP